MNPVTLLPETPWRDPRYNGEYGEREQLRKVVAVKRLKTKAKDNHGHEYEVSLKMENLPIGWVNPEVCTDDEFYNCFCFHWVMRISGTPGGWRMSTLLEDGKSYPDGILVDMGLNWRITNFQDVLDEAVRLI